MANWLSNGLLPLLALLALPLAAATLVPPAGGRRSLLERLTRRRGLWPVLTLTGLGLAFFFCYAATGQGPALRVKNLLYLYFLAGWLLSTGAVARRLDARTLAVLTAGSVRAGLLGWLLLAFLTDHNARLTHAGLGQQPNTVVQAYRDWLSGDAAQRARRRQVRAAPAGQRIGCRRCRCGLSPSSTPTFPMTPHSGATWLTRTSTACARWP